MKTDLYTRIVLTVIAACLVALVAGDARLIPQANAQMRSSKGPVYDEQGALLVKVVNGPVKGMTE
jgi:hypothetical protein